MALTGYLDTVCDHPFDGFLVHSRGKAGLSRIEPGRGARLEDVDVHAPVLLHDLTVPVIVLQTETDLFAPLWWLHARQPDQDLLRIWEVAGTAHCDRFQIGRHEPFLDCPDAINRGQQVYVMRAAMRWLESWATAARPHRPRPSSR
jgi:hypothetical protein